LIDLANCGQRLAESDMDVWIGRIDLTRESIVSNDIRPPAKLFSHDPDVSRKQRYPLWISRGFSNAQRRYEVRKRLIELTLRRQLKSGVETFTVSGRHGAPYNV